MNAATVALTIQAAAESAGVSITTIREAIRNKQLIARYPTSRPVIMVDDLRAWLEASPSERAG